MDQCTQCGAELGIGRFCTNCGHPVSASTTAESWRTDTAERPRVTVPPPAPSVPEPPRFPLYADQSGARAVDEPTAFLVPVVDTETTTEPPRHRGDEPPGGAGWVPWASGFLVMVLIALAGTWLLFSGDDQEPVLAQQEPSRSGDRTPGRDRSPEPEPTPTEKTPDETGEAVDLTPTARVDAPAPAPPSEDSSGNTVRYVATNMIDGLDETTWRMPGDGTGESITFRLDSPAVLTDVGLINGYAKVGEDSGGLLDWYAGNRRIFEVEWSFDDGTVVSQTLRETADMQTLALDDVETERVTLRLLEVSEPGSGRASRDYTAISDVSLVGTS